jgi:hypothetical protein
LTPFTLAHSFLTPWSLTLFIRPSTLTPSILTPFPLMVSPIAYLFIHGGVLCYNTVVRLSLSLCLRNSSYTFLGILMKIGATKDNIV